MDRKLGVSVVALAVVCIVGAGVIGVGAYALYDQFRLSRLPLCPEEQPPPGAPGPRELTGAEHALVEEVIRADERVRRIAGGQEFAVRTMPEYRTKTGENDGAADVSWAMPTAAPAADFRDFTEAAPPKKGRYTNLRRILVSVDFETRSVRKILPGLGARSDGVPTKRATCRSDH